MWLTRHLNFTTVPLLEEGVLLRASAIHPLQNFDIMIAMAEQQKADIIAEANRQVGEILDAAHTQANLLITTLVADREKKYIQRAEALFSDWQSAREQQELLLVQHAQQLVNKTLQHLFAQSDDPKKVTALLRQLLQANVREPDATLYCNPGQYDYVYSWMQDHAYLSWSLKTDDVLKMDNLLLQTANGELSISWSHLQESLLNVVKL